MVSDRDMLGSMNRRNFFKGALASLAAMVAAPFLKAKPKVFWAGTNVPRAEPMPPGWRPVGVRSGRTEFQIRHLVEVLRRSPDASVLILSSHGEEIRAEVCRRVAEFGILNPQLHSSTGQSGGQSATTSWCYESTSEDKAFTIERVS